jgi:hypothetical protein
MKPGDRVLIDSPGIGSCAGTIVEIAAPEDLPPIEEAGGTGGLAVLTGILEEIEVTRIYLIAYEPDQRNPTYRLIFAVLETRDGQLRDLRRQPITLSKISGSQRRN